jgi:hypothetical protein
MTLPENDHPRKPRRLGLYAPFVLLIVAIAAWSFGWMRMRDEVFRHMDDYARAAAETGWRLDWKSRSLSGFPFRLDLDVSAPRAVEASGWGLSAPRLKAEAFVFSADHWIIVAPEGASLRRRIGGPLTIGARALRASLSDVASHPARVSVEGLDLTFTAPPGAAPSPIASAAGLHIHTKAGPSDQGAAYVEIDAARLAGDGALAILTGNSPVTFKADAIFSHASALTGPGIGPALNAWSAAGGAVAVRGLSLDWAGARIDTTSGDLALDQGGRLKGRLALRAKPADTLLRLLAGRNGASAPAFSTARAVLSARTAADRADVTMDFQAGETTLGPVGVGPSPRIY